MTQFFSPNPNPAYDPLMHNAVFRSLPYGQWEAELTETLEAEFTTTPSSDEPTEQSKRADIMGPFAILALLVIGAMPLFFTGTHTASVNANTMHQAEASTQQLINLF